MSILTNEQLTKARKWYDGLSWKMPISMNKPFRFKDIGIDGREFYTYIYNERMSHGSR